MKLIEFTINSKHKLIINKVKIKYKLKFCNNRWFHQKVVFSPLNKKNKINKLIKIKKLRLIKILKCCFFKILMWK